MMSFQYRAPREHASAQSGRDGQRLNDLRTIQRRKFGIQIPDTAEGRAFARCMAHHQAQAGNDVRLWLLNFCPWMSRGDRDRLIEEIAKRPERWRAARLGRVLGFSYLQWLAWSDPANPISTIRPCDRTPEQLAELKRERRNAKRRAKRLSPRKRARADAAAARQEAIDASGKSRATFYRHKRAAVYAGVAATVSPTTVTPRRPRGRPSPDARQRFNEKRRAKRAADRAAKLAEEPGGVPAMAWRNQIRETDGGHPAERALTTTTDSSLLLRGLSAATTRVSPFGYASTAGLL
jgi:hypothetical protein